MMMMMMMMMMMFSKDLRMNQIKSKANVTTYATFSTLPRVLHQ